MVLREDLALILLQDIFITLRSKRSFGARTDAIETTSMSDRRLLEIQDVETTRCSTYDDDDCSIVPPYVLCAIHGSILRILLLPLLSSESLVSV